MSFPKPDLPDDPDVLVLGSRNGVGKTSVLEALSIGAWFRLFWTDAKPQGVPEDAALDAFVRAGTSKFDLSLDGGSPATGWHVAYSTGSSPSAFGFTETPKMKLNGTSFSRDFNRLRGRDVNPVLLPGLLHFTGFRRVLEGDLDMEDLGGRRQVVIGTPPSIFKVDAAEALIGAAGVFENFASADWVLRVRQINSLVDRYAGGVIEKLATNLHGSIRLRVRARDSAASHDFDGLSSGQKEIISTLYLIWRHTLDNPSLVLIDEPELHLNAEWRVDYVRMLHRIAPHNQYILATHSEDIFASVDPSRRIILNPVAVPV